MTGQGDRPSLDRDHDIVNMTSPMSPRVIIGNHDCITILDIGNTASFFKVINIFNICVPRLIFRAHSDVYGMLLNRSTSDLTFRNKRSSFL